MNLNIWSCGLLVKCRTLRCIEQAFSRRLLWAATTPVSSVLRTKRLAIQPPVLSLVQFRPIANSLSSMLRLPASSRQTHKDLERIIDHPLQALHTPDD